MKIGLQRGDEFVVRTRSKIAPIIIAGQKIRDIEGEAWANHGGILIDPDGTTFESLLTIGRYHIDRYAGCRILIVRHKRMTDGLFDEAWEKLRKLEGLIYPVWRLPLHLLGLAKFIHWKFTVCSEVCTKMEFECGLRRSWWGYNPNNLADEWIISKHYTIKCEGVWNGLS